jgi:hypothetical protein
MTTPPETETWRERRTIYIVAAIAVVGLLIAGLVVWNSAKSSSQAEDKANQLIAALEASGGHAPSQDQIVRVLDNDGGAVCANPAAGLSKAILLAQLANGAGGPGTRPIIADSRVVQGELAILKIYCPDKLPDFQSFAGKLAFAKTING